MAYCIINVVTTRTITVGFEICFMTSLLIIHGVYNSEIKQNKKHNCLFVLFHMLNLICNKTKKC